MSQKKSKGMKTLLSFYSKKDDEGGTSGEIPHSLLLGNSPLEEQDQHLQSKDQGQHSPQKEQEERPSKLPKIGGTINDTIKYDPGLRQAIWKYPYNEQDGTRRHYIGMGPCRQNLQKYPRNPEGRCFRYKWFEKYDWVEYSEAKDKAYCFPCFLFDSNTSQHHKQSAWISEGFDSWKRFGGKDCSFKLHEGDPGSLHGGNVMMLEGLKSSSHSIEKRLFLQSNIQVNKNRLRVLTTVNAIRWLACQGCALRGNDEKFDSLNRGNFLELLKYTAALSPQVAEVVLDNAPQNAIYASSTTQNQILKVIGDLVRRKICEELGESKYCILVDESQDESNCEQMAIVLRFVDRGGRLRERFFEVVGVEDTTASTLKRHCSDVLDRNGLLVQNMRGQGYDGASNMRGAWNGLQALFLHECPFAYYVHCFAHQLQLALVAASSERSDVELFFQMTTCIINLIRASPKRSQQLKTAREKEVQCLIESGELQTSQGGNQKSTVHRAASTRWSSHYYCACSLYDLYTPACEVLQIIAKEGLTRKICAEATGALIQMSSFQFVFILHSMIKVMGITEVLSQALQKKTQDILNGLNCISVTKTLLLELKRDDKWQSFLHDVVAFCTKHDIDVPIMTSRYMKGTSRSCQQNDEITNEHHYRYDMLHETIEAQVMELGQRFSNKAIELLSLSSALDPKGSFKSLRIDDLCMLAKKYYPNDFTEMEINHQLRHQLQHYECDMRLDPAFQKISTLPKLCRKLKVTGKDKRYALVDRLIRLVLTLPVTTATTERAFSAMKFIKTRLRNKMGNDLLSNHMMLYIEREIALSLDPEDIVDEFDRRENRRVKHRIL